MSTRTNRRGALVGGPEVVAARARSTSETRLPAARPEQPIGRPKRLLPEDHLERAMAAASPRARAGWARRGLAHRGPLDPTTQAMLLRQLYLSHYAEERFEAAYEVAAQALDLDVLPDVLHQDAARAKQALGELEAAVGHLRLAARTSPPSRKAFHCWTLGSVLLLAGRHAEAIAALGRAARWGTTDKPLYEGHLAAAKLAAGQTVRHPERLIERLAACPAGQGYGRFVLGLLSHHTGQRHAAREYLGAFVKRVSEGQRMTAMALRGELALARELLGEDDLC